ncbi:hypothetical protein KAU11_08660 [Candidatus Babeliales bacterium]|nr:hypothetical protein [Candidatus Babeliales bacterium]
MIKATKERIVLKSVPMEETTEGGIVIPGTVRKQHAKGEVINVGPEVDDINVGDIVLFPSFEGMPIVVEGTECLVIPAAKVLAILEG